MSPLCSGKLLGYGVQLLMVPWFCAMPSAGPFMGRPDGGQSVFTTFGPN
jgi:hypothetical protein